MLGCQTIEIAPARVQLYDLRVVASGRFAGLGRMASMAHQALGDLVDRALEGEPEEEVGVLKSLPERFIPPAGGDERRASHHRARRDDAGKRKDRREGRLQLSVREHPDAPSIASVARVHPRRSRQRTTGLIDEGDAPVNHTEPRIGVELAHEALEHRGIQFVVGVEKEKIRTSGCGLCGPGVTSLADASVWQLEDANAWVALGGRSGCGDRLVGAAVVHDEELPKLLTLRANARDRGSDEPLLVEARSDDRDEWTIHMCRVGRCLVFTR